MSSAVGARYHSAPATQHFLPLIFARLVRMAVGLMFSTARRCRVAGNAGCLPLTRWLQPLLGPALPWQGGRMAENKTQPTTQSVDDFLAGLTERRRTEASTLIGLMGRITGEEPVMWGPSIIGFGSVHYRYDSGREGDIPVLGFSPRKARLTIYFSEGFDRYGEQLAKLGKHSISVSCLYATKLADIDLDVLATMLRVSADLATSSAAEAASTEDAAPAKITTAAGYAERVPAAARPLLDELRGLVRDVLPDADEVLSYGVIGYRVARGRCRVFVGGWADHVSLYPVPKDEELAAELAPYQRGKGTLWFRLDAELPHDLIRRVVARLAA